MRRMSMCAFALLVAAAAAALPARSINVRQLPLSEMQAAVAALEADGYVREQPADNDDVGSMSTKRVMPLEVFTGGVVAVGANGVWRTPYLIARNLGAARVIQKVGHVTFTKPGFDPVVLEPTVTIEPGETKRVKNLEANFDSDWRQFGAGCSQPGALCSIPGMYVLPIDSHLQAATFLTYGDGPARFEFSCATKYLQAQGSRFDYHLIATDASTSTGTYVTVLNTNDAPVLLVIREIGPLGGGDRVDRLFTARPGISQAGVARPLESGGSVSVCLGSCDIGLGGGVSAPVYVRLYLGQNDGGTQAARDPEP